MLMASSSADFRFLFFFLRFAVKKKKTKVCSDCETTKGKKERRKKKTKKDITCTIAFNKAHTHTQKKKKTVVAALSFKTWECFLSSTFLMEKKKRRKTHGEIKKKKTRIKVHKQM